MLNSFPWDTKYSKKINEKLKLGSYQKDQTPIVDNNIYALGDNEITCEGLTDYFVSSVEIIRSYRLAGIIKEISIRRLSKTPGGVSFVFNKSEAIKILSNYIYCGRLNKYKNGKHFCR